jgi:hypothetical protein
MVDYPVALARCIGGGDHVPEIILVGIDTG